MWDVQCGMIYWTPFRFCLNILPVNRVPTTRAKGEPQKTRTNSFLSPEEDMSSSPRCLCYTAQIQVSRIIPRNESSRRHFPPVTTPHDYDGRLAGTDSDTFCFSPRSRGQKCVQQEGHKDLPLSITQLWIEGEAYRFNSLVVRNDFAIQLFTSCSVCPCLLPNTKWATV